MKPASIEQALSTHAAARDPAEARLPETHESFRQLVGPVQDYAIFLLDAQGHVLSWNAGAERINGYKVEEIVGQHFSRFYPPEAIEQGWPQRELEMACNEGRCEDENWRVRKDGSRFWASVVITPWKDRAGALQGFLKITRDLTERKQAEEKFRGLLESAPDAMVIVDKQGKIVLVNSQTEKLFGYGREELVGQPIDILVPEQGRAKHVQGRQRYVANPVPLTLGVGLELYGLRKNGSLVPVEISLSPLQTPEGLLVSSAVRDMTERKRVQERLETFSRQLQRSNRELEQFASIAAHDLQEPLRKIEAFGDRLKAKCEDQLGEQGKDYLGRILGSTARMRRLINDLLAFSRVTTKAKPFEPVDLEQIAQETLADLEGSIQETKGRVEVDELPSVEADPLQMRQLLQNLIGNALKFHKPDEPPVVKVESRRIGEPGHAPLCVLTVEDNGIGFEEQYLDRIFQIFQRLHGRQEYEGTGIGLAICRKIAERHNGAITARSQLGRGSIFVVTLPLQQPKEGEHSEQTNKTDHDLDGRR